MFRIILIVVVLALASVGGIAVALFHFYGWKGLIAFPFILIAFAWLAKMVIGRLFKKFALGLFTMKSSALRGAAMTIHTITPVSKPPEPEVIESDSEADNDDGEVTEDSEPETDATEQPEEPRHYFVVDMTVTPKGDGHFWEPGEFILTSEKLKGLEDLESGEKEAGTATEVLVWDGRNFCSDEAGKYQGAQRIKVTFEVKPDISKTWLHYYSETIGALDLPKWKV